MTIKPETIPGSLSIAIIGLRDLVPSINLFPIKKIYCKFDISGDSKEPVKTNKHAVIGGSCNVLEVITLDMDVPVLTEFSPVLTVYIYDTIMGFMGERLVGVANIPLYVHCKRMTKQMK